MTSYGVLLRYNPYPEHYHHGWRTSETKLKGKWQDFEIHFDLHFEDKRLNSIQRTQVLDTHSLSVFRSLNLSWQSYYTHLDPPDLDTVEGRSLEVVAEIRPSLTNDRPLLRWEVGGGRTDGGGWGGDSGGGGGGRGQDSTTGLELTGRDKSAGILWGFY